MNKCSVAVNGTSIMQNVLHWVALLRRGLIHVRWAAERNTNIFGKLYIFILFRAYFNIKFMHSILIGNIGLECKQISILYLIRNKNNVKYKTN